MSFSSQKLTQFIRQLFYILFFFTPLILWPYTSEVFEFNKMMFVYLITILIGATWLTKSLLNKRFEITRSPLDIPIFLFLASQTISTVLSINPHTSLWGYYSRFHGGLMSTISYTVLYYALVTHFSGQTKAIKNIFLAILSSATVISLYAVAEHLGIDKNVWVQDVQNRVFSTLGQPNWLSAFLVALLPIALFQTLKIGSKRYLYFGLSCLYLTAIVFTKSQSGLGATAVILFLFFIISAIQSKKSWLLLALIPLLAFTIIFKGEAIQRTLSSLNKINPFYSNTLSIINEENKTRIGGSDSMTIRRVVWEGAIKLGLEYPFFGTGVETYGYSYYWVRPATHNLTSETDFLYNKAHNEYLNFLATTGFIGLGTYLLLIVFIFKTLSKKEHLPLLLGFISILITNYFGFSVVNIALFFFLYPALAIASDEKVKLTSLKYNLDPTIAILVVTTLSVWLIIGLGRSWTADIAYNKGKGNLDEAKKAVSLNPREPVYFAQLGNLNALIVSQLILPQIKEIPATASPEIKLQAKAYLDKYVNEALNNINKAVTMNPWNLNLLKIKAKTELSLLEIDSKLSQDALATLLKIAELSPTEPNNYINIGIIYQSIGNTDLARTAFEKALLLNPDSQSAKDYLNKLK